MSKEIPLNQLTLFPEDSPANLSQLQENKEEQTMTVTSGMKLLESYPFTNPDGLLAKMWKDLLTSKTAWCSDRCKMTWKKKVSKSNVVLFQLAASVLGIKERESGLLHTPTATANQGAPSMYNRDQGSWGNHMYATPNTMDHLPPRSKEGTLKLQQGHRKGRSRPSNLREQVDPQTMAMYPTPNAWDSARGAVSEDYIKKNPKTQISLVTRVKQEQRKGMYPTPTTQDSRIGPNNIKGSQHRKERGNPALADKVLFPTPTTQEIEHPDMVLNEKGRRMPKKGKTDHSLNLADTVRMMYPSPTATNVNTPQPERVERTKSGGFILRKKNKPHMTYGARLQDAMMYLENKKMYPTPVAKDNCTESLETWEKRSEKHKAQGKTIPKALRIQVQKESKMFPTPTQRDYKDTTVSNSYQKRNSDSLPVKMMKEGKVGGRLNPNFVEFLMGYPMNWTKVE